MGTTPSQSPPSSPSSPALPFPTFCGTSSNQETLKNTKKTEIDLTSTYSLPKGTFTNDSIHLFTSMEKTLFNIIPTSNIPALRYLTINNVNINILDEDRTSPLHVASRFSSVQMIEEVINQGAMINIPDIVGWTSLHIACYYDRPDVTLLLLKNGANYKTRNRDKETPRDLALKNNCLSCVKVIDNFCKYQKIEIEKFVNELNSGFKNKINLRFDDVFKKYLKYQKLRGEFLKSHLDFNEKEEEEEGLSDNFEEKDNFNNFNNYNNNGNMNEELKDNNQNEEEEEENEIYYEGQQFPNQPPSSDIYNGNYNGNFENMQNNYDLNNMNNNIEPQYNNNEVDENENEIYNEEENKFEQDVEDYNNNNNQFQVIEEEENENNTVEGESNKNKSIKNNNSNLNYNYSNNINNANVNPNNQNNNNINIKDNNINNENNSEEEYISENQINEDFVNKNISQGQSKNSVKMQDNKNPKNNKK